MFSIIYFLILLLSSGFNPSKMLHPSSSIKKKNVAA